MSKSITANAEGNTRPQNLRCRPGDLAIVTRCDNPRHIGRLVTIQKRSTLPQSDWIVELVGTPVRGRSIFTGRIGEFARVTVFDWNLTPIAGEEPEFSESDAEVDHV